MNTYNGPNPHEREIVRLLGEPNPNTLAITIQRVLSDGYESGYRRAKAEDAPLLEVLQHIEEAYKQIADKPPYELRPLLLRLDELRPAWRAAIAQATGKEAQQ